MSSFSQKLSFFNSLSLERTANFFQGCLQSRIFYLHIPKCAGTSVNRALQACYHKWTLGDTCNFFTLNHPASWQAAEILSGSEINSDVVNDEEVMSLREKLLIYYMAQEHVAYIGGHFRFSERAHRSFGEKYSYITIIRHPVKRWTSSYLYNRYRNPAKYRRIEMSLEEYLESDFGKSQGYEYAKFLGHSDGKTGFMTQEAVDKAKENLHKFQVIGFLEDMGDFQQQFQTRFGRRLNIQRLNQRPSNDKSLVNINEAMIKKIEEICAPDMEIYDYAVKKFASIRVQNLLLKS